MEKKILFINPTMITEAPTTLAMLAGVAEKYGFSSRAAVNTFKKPLGVKDFVKEAKDYGAGIVGISMMTFEILFCYELVKELKKEGFLVIVGGVHPTDCPEECIEAGADVVIQGEGESVFEEILKKYPNIKKGIRERKSPVDLAALPSPKLDIFDLDVFKIGDGLIKGFQRIYTSRGCPGRCTFCDWQVFKQNIRFYPISAVIDEIKKRVEKYDITNFNIADDCFTINHERVYEFCEQIKKIKPKISWQAQSRANLVNPELLKAMKDAGCYLICFGFESGDPETLLKVKKFVTLEQNIKTAWMAHDAGLEIYGTLMTGFPWETEKNVQNQIDFIHKTWDAVSLFTVSGSLIPFPGTEIYREYAKQYGFEKYWLKPDYQELGLQIYQNVLNPLATSTFYQRIFFDDTYIKKEYFFKYTPGYKKKVREMVWELGKHNLVFMFKDQVLKQKLYLAMGKLSMLGENMFPGLEKKIGGGIFHLFHKEGQRSGVEKLRDKKRRFTKK